MTTAKTAMYTFTTTKRCPCGTERSHADQQGTE